MKYSNLISRGKTILIQLLIVFVGVYLAFLLDKYQKQNQIASERDKVLTSLKYELDDLRIKFPGMATYQTNRVQEWDSLFKEKKFMSFYTWRYIQPQYDFTTIEYAINTRETEIVDFEMHNSLVKLFNEIKQLKNIEEQITSIGFKYKNIPTSLQEENKEYQILYAENLLLFYKFIDFARLRAGALDRIAYLAKHCLQIINSRLGFEKQKEVELAYVKELLTDTDWVKSITKKEAIGLQQQHFPNLPDKEVNVLLKETFGE